MGKQRLWRAAAGSFLSCGARQPPRSGRPRHLAPGVRDRQRRVDAPDLLVDHEQVFGVLLAL